MSETDQGKISQYSSMRKRRLYIYVLAQLMVASSAVAIGVFILARKGNILYKISDVPSSIVMVMAGGAALGVAAAAIGMASSFMLRSIPRRVFVSFSYKDIEFVRPLIAALRDNGVDVVLAEDTIRVGDNVLERIKELIRSSSHAIVVVSDNYDESYWAAIELGMLDRRIKVLPILYKTDNVPTGLEVVQHIKTDAINENLLHHLLPALPKISEV